MKLQLFLILEKFLMTLPKSWRKKFFSALAIIAYYASPKYRKIAKQNIIFAFDGTKSNEEIDSIIRYAYKNLLLNFLHLMELRHITKDELKKMISVENIEAVKRVHDKGKCAIYITPHYSSWELTGAGVGIFSEPVIAVYKKMKNPTFQDWLLEARGAFGNISMEKTNVVKPLIRNIKNGIAPGLLIDTNINHKEGVIVKFMGKDIRQTSTPAYLARKFNASIIPVIIRTDDEENYTLIFFDEIKVDETEDIKADIFNATQKQADWLTSVITKEPKFWFWLHRRWKGDHPEIYNDGNK